MKTIIFTLLSALASGAPQDQAGDLERVLTSVFEELAIATQEVAEAQEGAASNNNDMEARLEQLGLQIAEGALVAVSDLLPAIASTAGAALREVEYQFAAADRVMIGITGGPPSAALCSHLNIEPTRAIIINSIAPGLSAAQAGLREHDVIIKIDGLAEATMSNLRDVLAASKIGDVLKLVIISNGQRQTKLVPILEAQEWSPSAKAGISLYVDVPEQDAAATREYREALRTLAEHHADASRVKSEIESAEAEISAAQAAIEVAEREIIAARQEYERARAEFGQDSSARDQLQQDLRTLKHDEALVARESNRLQVLRMDVLQHRIQRELDASLEEKLRAQTEARFTAGGRWSSLILPEQTGTWQQSSRSSERLDQVEERIHELHSRFDRFEEMLEVLVTRKNN